MFGAESPPGSLRVKICGITNATDAEAAIEAGADALGLNCYQGSKRYLDLKVATDWLGKLPEEIRKIAVLVNPTFEEAVAVASLSFITGLQLHGNESPQFCSRLAERGLRFAKALPVPNETSLHNVPSFATRWIVLDSVSAPSFGGTGQTFSWPIAQRFVVGHPDLHVILAGGLTPENVAEAIRAVRPFGVDVTSGVESVPGHKDHARLRAFVQAARAAASS